MILGKNTRNIPQCRFLHPFPPPPFLVRDPPCTRDCSSDYDKIWRLTPDACFVCYDTVNAVEKKMCTRDCSSEYDKIWRLTPNACFVCYDTVNAVEKKMCTRDCSSEYDKIWRLTPDAWRLFCLLRYCKCCRKKKCVAGNSIFSEYC